MTNEEAFNIAMSALDAATQKGVYNINDVSKILTAMNHINQELRKNGKLD